MSFQKQVEVMASGGSGYNNYYSRRESEIDFLDLQLHLGRMEINTHTYDLHRIGYEPHRTETEITAIRKDLELLEELSSQKERITYHSTPDLFKEVERLKIIKTEREDPQENILSLFQSGPKPA